MGKAPRSMISRNNTGKDGEIWEMRKEIKEICDERGLTDDTRCPLAKALLEAARISEEKGKNLRKELEGENVWKKRSIKKQLEEEEERRANLMKWGVWCQGVEH